MIDLRSDTVTKPSPRMYEAMAAAEVGDDVYGDDPTINELEETVADMLGFEAGMYVTSGTQSNFAAVLTHCGRGEEYIIGEAYHVYRAEAVGTAALGGIIPQTVPVLDDGSVDLAVVESRRCSIFVSRLLLQFWDVAADMWYLLQAITALVFTATAGRTSN